jgi:hypothetical protein
MVADWSVDRLGRSLTDLLDVLRALHATIPFEMDKVLPILKLGKQHFYVSGMLFYHDIFEERHWSRFCFSWSFDELVKVVNNAAPSSAELCPGLNDND